MRMRLALVGIVLAACGGTDSGDTPSTTTGGSESGSAVTTDPSTTSITTETGSESGTSATTQADSESSGPSTASSSGTSESSESSGADASSSESGGVPQCDPLAQDCERPACYPAAEPEGFECQPGQPPFDVGETPTECDADSPCSVNVNCLPARVLVGCDGEGCCVPPMQCAEHSECPQGMACQPAETIHGCAGQLCCTPMCDPFAGDCFFPAECLQVWPTINEVGACAIPA